MFDYMLRRLVMTFFVVVLIMTFLSLLIHLVPGDPVRLLLGAKAPEQLILQVRHQMCRPRSTTSSGTPCTATSASTSPASAR
jgi:ABC-type dipeptide/oligopeptide/nickel transport system permease component